MSNKITITVLLFCALAVNTNAQEQAKGEFTLPKLIAKAIDYHPSIKRNLFLEDSAKEDVTSAKWQYFPTPQFSVSQVNASSTDRNYSGDNRVTTLSLTQPLWSGGAIDAGLEKSRAQFLLAGANTKVAQQELALRVISSYSEWYGSYLTKEAHKKSQEEYDALHTRLQRRAKQGLSSSSDLNLADARLNRANASFNSSVIQHENALLRLEELLGIALSPQDLIKDFGIIKLKNNENKLSQRALLNSPKIKQVKAEILAVEAEIKESKAQLYPTVSLKAQKQWGDFNTQNAKSENRVFVEFNSSFGAGLSNLSNTRKIENRHQALQSKIENAKKETTQQIRLDWMSIVSLKKQEALFKSSLASTEEVQKSYYRQFLVGRKTWREVTSSIGEVAELESKLADAYKNMIVASWRIFVYVEDIDSVVAPTNAGLALSRIDKVLWYPSIEPRKEENVIDRILNKAIPDEKPIEKIIWYFDVDSTTKLKSSSKKKESFVDFIKLFDNVPITDAAPITIKPKKSKQSATKIVKIPPVQAPKPTLVVKEVNRIKSTTAVENTDGKISEPIQAQVSRLKRREQSALIAVKDIPIKGKTPIKIPVETPESTAIISKIKWVKPIAIKNTIIKKRTYVKPALLIKKIKQPVSIMVESTPIKEKISAPKVIITKVKWINPIVIKNNKPAYRFDSSPKESYKTIWRSKKIIQ